MFLRSLIAAVFGSTLLGSTVVVPMLSSGVMEKMPAIDGGQMLPIPSRSTPQRAVTPAASTNNAPPSGTFIDDIGFASSAADTATREEADAPRHKGHDHEGEGCEGKRGKGHDANHRRGHGPPPHAQNRKQGHGPPAHARGAAKGHGKGNGKGHGRR